MIVLTLQSKIQPTGEQTMYKTLLLTAAITLVVTPLHATGWVEDDGRPHNRVQFNRDAAYCDMITQRSLMTTDMEQLIARTHNFELCLQMKGYVFRK
jgi:hypothetical protein